MSSIGDSAVQANRGVVIICGLCLRFDLITLSAFFFSAFFTFSNHVLYVKSEYFSVCPWFSVDSVLRSGFHRKLKGWAEAGFGLFFTFVNHILGVLLLAGLKRDANIFRVLETIKEAWASIESFDTSGFSEFELESWTASQKRFVFDGVDVRKAFLDEFEDYLFSCEWTESGVVRDIVGYIKDGVPLGKIGDLVGLKNSAFRMRIFRLTSTINEQLFDGQTCPEGIYSLSDLGALKKALVKLRLVRDPVNINEEFTRRHLEWMKAHVEGSEKAEIGHENLEKYFQSVLYLALTSRTFTLNLLDEIDPSVLQYALSDMQSDGVNSTKLLFSLLLKRLSSASVACKEELLTVKREYQDYMRG